MKPDDERASPAEPADHGHPRGGQVPACRQARTAARHGRHQRGAVRQGEGVPGGLGRGLPVTRAGGGQTTGHTFRNMAENY